MQLHLSVSSASSPGKRGKGSECQERSFELDRRRRQGSEPKACTPGAVTQSLGQASRARRDWTRNLLVVNYERAAGVAAMQWTLVRGGEASCALKSYRGFRAEDVRSNQRSAWLRPWHACSLTGSARNAGPGAACSARAAPSRSRLPFVTECNKRVSKRQTVRPLKVARLLRLTAQSQQQSPPSSLKAR